MTQGAKSELFMIHGSLLIWIHFALHACIRLGLDWYNIIRGVF